MSKSTIPGIVTGIAIILVISLAVNYMMTEETENIPTITTTPVKETFLMYVDHIELTDNPNVWIIHDSAENGNYRHINTSIRELPIPGYWYTFTLTDENLTQYVISYNTNDNYIILDNYTTVTLPENGSFISGSVKTMFDFLDWRNPNFNFMVVELTECPITSYQSTFNVVTYKSDWYSMISFDVNFHSGDTFDFIIHAEGETLLHYEYTYYPPVTAKTVEVA